MRFINVNSIKEGMILAKPLLGKNDELLLNRGVVLFSSYVSKIKQHGYNGIYIEDRLSEATPIIRRIIFSSLKRYWPAVHNRQQTGVCV
jgi:hypothetical protein